MRWRNRHLSCLAQGSLRPCVDSVGLGLVCQVPYTNNFTTSVFRIIRGTVRQVKN